MNIEELKLVLETINTTTGLAKDMGTTWIWLHYAFKLFDGLLVVGCIWGVAYAIYRTVVFCNGIEEDARFIRKCRDRLRIGSPGALSPNERHDTQDKIIQLIDKHNEEKKA